MNAFGAAPGSMPSTTGEQSRFAQVPPMPHPRSVFDRSCGHKTGLVAGKLFPLIWDWVLPGDTINMAATLLARTATFVRPVMDNVFIDIQFFFVPCRLLWENFTKFMGEVEPGDSTEYTMPTIDAPAGGFLEDSLADYLGIPPGFDFVDLNALPFRAINRVYNEWYRDQNLQDSVPLPLDDGPDDPADYVLLPRGKRHDYFTSSLPWPEAGGVQVPVPLGTTAPILGTATPPTFDVGTGVNLALNSSGAGTIVNWSGAPGPAGSATWNTTGLVADLANATAAGLNALRESIALQQLLEREARGGRRYIELVRSSFGVVSSDARLQRSEFLGGGTSRVDMNQVPLTGFNPSAPVGELSAWGYSLMPRRGFVKTFEEHGIMLGLVSVRADLNYQQGLERGWRYSTKYDFPWPEFMNLGEQEVRSQEIYADGSANDDDIFGYQERFAEWRYKPSRVSSVMRSSHSQTTEVWHLAQDFASRPTLGATFIEENPPMARVQAVTSDVPQFILDSWFEFRHARPLPTYSVPGLSRF